MKQVDKDGRRANKDVREERRIYFSKISRKQSILGLVSMLL